MKKGRFKPYNVKYWTTTYIELNPFMGIPKCPTCKTYDRLVQRSYMINPATELYEFRCKQCGAEFTRSKTWD